MALWLYLLCDIAMCGNHGIGERYGSILDLLKCIARDDDIWSLRYHKKERLSNQSFKLMVKPMVYSLASESTSGIHLYQMVPSDISLKYS